MKIKNILILLVLIGFCNSLSAQKYLSTANVDVTKEWKGNDFTSKKSFAENIQDAPQFTVLKKILKDDALRKSLESQEMVTIFAIADEGFLKLPKEKRDSILGNKQIVNSIVKFLAISGRMDSYTLKAAVKRHGGVAYLATLNGQKLGIKEENGQLMLVDDQNNTATITDTDFYHKNGFFHIIDGLVFPSSE